MPSTKRVGTHPAWSKNDHRQTHASEISIPESSRPVRLRPKILRYSKQPHHQIIHFHVLEPIHNVDVVRGRVPSLILVRHPGLMVQGFHNVRERTMGDKHCVHPEVSVVVPVALRVEFDNQLKRVIAHREGVDSLLCSCQTRHDLSSSERTRTSERYKSARFSGCVSNDNAPASSRGYKRRTFHCCSLLLPKECSDTWWCWPQERIVVLSMASHPRVQ